MTTRKVSELSNFKIIPGKKCRYFIIFENAFFRKKFCLLESTIKKNRVEDKLVLRKGKAKSKKIAKKINTLICWVAKRGSLKIYE